MSYAEAVEYLYNKTKEPEVLAHPYMKLCLVSLMINLDRESRDKARVLINIEQLCKPEYLEQVFEWPRLAVGESDDSVGVLRSNLGPQ